MLLLRSKCGSLPLWGLAARAWNQVGPACFCVAGATRRASGATFVAKRNTLCVWSYLGVADAVHNSGGDIQVDIQATRPSANRRVTEKNASSIEKSRPYGGVFCPAS